MFLLYIFLSFCVTVTSASSKDVASSIEEEHHHHSFSTTETNAEADGQISDRSSVYHEELTHKVNDFPHSEVQENDGVISVKHATIKNAELLNKINESSIENGEKTKGEFKLSASPESETTEEAATEKQENKDEKTEEKSEIDRTAHISVDKHFKSVPDNVEIRTPEHRSSEAFESARKYFTEPSKESVKARTFEHSLSVSGEHESIFSSTETSQGIGSQESDAEDYEGTEHHTSHVFEHYSYSSEIIQEGKVSTTTTVEEAISSKSPTKLRETRSIGSQILEPDYYSHTSQITQQCEQTSEGPETGSNEEANSSKFKSHTECHGVISTTAESDKPERQENTEKDGFLSTKTLKLKDSTAEVTDFSEDHSSIGEGLEQKSEEEERSTSVKKNIGNTSKSHLKNGTDLDSDHGSQDFIQSFHNIIEETTESESIEEISRETHETVHTPKNAEVLTPVDEGSLPKESSSGESLVLWSEPFLLKNLAISEEEETRSNNKTSEEQSHCKETTPSEVLDKYSDSTSSESLAIGKTEEELTSRNASETAVSASELSSGDSSSTYNRSSNKVQKETPEKFSSAELSVTTEHMKQSNFPALSLRINSETGKEVKAKSAAFPVYHKKFKKQHIFKPIDHPHSTVKIEGFFLGLGTTPCKYYHHEHKKSTTRIRKWQASGNTKQHKISLKHTRAPEMVEKHIKKSESSYRYFNEVLTTVEMEKNFVGGETTPCEYCKSSTKKPKFVTRATEKASKITEKRTKKIESTTHKPSSSNGLLTTVEIEQMFAGGGTPCEYCKSSEPSQESESHTHRVDTGGLHGRHSTASELETFKNTKEMEKPRENHTTHGLVAPEESSESAAIEAETRSSDQKPASHEEAIENQEEKVEEIMSPRIYKLKKSMKRVQKTSKIYDNGEKVSETTKELQRKTETTREISRYGISEAHEMTTISGIHPRNILILIHGNEPPQNSNSYMTKIEIDYKALNRYEADSASLTHYRQRVFESYPKSCMKRDFEAGIHCFCDISTYLHTLETKILKKEQIKSTVHYCESFFQTDLLEIKKSPNSRRRRTSIVDFESSMRQCGAELEFDNIDGVFEGDFTLPLKGKTLYRLPTESMTIHCGNYSMIEAPTEEKLTFIWTFRLSSSTIAEELPEKNNKLVLHRISPKNAGNYSCSLASKRSVMFESWHKLEVLNFPIYEIKLNIFYRINDSCSIQTGEDLKWHIPKLFGPLLCSDKREICNLEVDNPRCLTREEDNYYNITIHVKSNPDVVFLLQSKCSIDCKLSFYENLVHMVYRNAEVLEHTNISTLSEIDHLHEIMFTPHHSTTNGTAITTKLPKIIVTCPAGYGLEATKQRVCVMCPRNTYSKDNHSFCKVCSEGNHQPNPGAESCIKCNSPVDASVCLRMLYTDTNLFKVYVGAVLGFVTLLTIILVVWISGFKNQLHDGKIDPGSLEHEKTNQCLSPDLERGYCECLLKTAPPQIPPVDF